MGARHNQATGDNDVMPGADAASGAQVGIIRRWLRSVRRGLSVLGVATFAYVLGAAVLFFHLPTSDFLNKAFLAANAWNESRDGKQASNDDMTPLLLPKVDLPGKTFDGYTLFSYHSVTTPIKTEAFLVDMYGSVVHKWSFTFSQIWPNASHLEHRVDDTQVGIFACHLYPDGDLLAVLQTVTQPTRGLGLVKLDKNSKVLWKYAAAAHHDVDVGEDGSIYAITQQPVSESPKDMGFIPSPWIRDCLVKLSSEGKELLPPVPVLEALRNSHYAPLLSPLEASAAKHETLDVKNVGDFLEHQDVLHTNSVQILTTARAPQFPGLKAGQALISIRNLNILAVVDLDERKAVWATTGPWRGQHAAKFLDNGRLLLFDNLGSALGSRVLEYDPKTQGFTWSYAGENLGTIFSRHGGQGQRLPNGNTLVMISQRGAILEITPEKEIVWTYLTPGFAATVRRYSENQIQFLKGDQHARY